MDMVEYCDFERNKNMTREEAAEEYAYQGIPDGMKSTFKPLADEIAKYFIAGAEWQREQMMEEAMEADVNTYEDIGAGASWAEFVVKMPTKNLGDKIKVIVIKEEK